MNFKQKLIDFLKFILDFLEHTSFITTTLSIILLISFFTTKRETIIFDILDKIFIWIIIFKAIYGFFYMTSKRTSMKGVTEFLTAVFFLIIYAWANYLNHLEAPKEIKPVYEKFSLILKGVLYCFYLIIHKKKITDYIKKLKLDTVRSFTLGFIFLILLGSWLLSLPYATLKPTSYLDNLFMSTSAVCVTGLATVDFGTQYTLFGQIVTLFLIQIGGLGIMTFTSFILFFSGDKMSYEERKGALEIFNQQNLQTLKGLLATMLISTFLIELIGAISIFISVSHFEFWDRAFFSIFHAVSAFCNAGFSPLPDNLMGFYNHYNINITISTLIVLGGLGFPVILNIKERLMNKKPLIVHSKIVIIMTVTLIVLGTLIFYFEENQHILKNFNPDGKFLSSLFQSVTTRTAGFNTVDIANLQVSTYIWLTILMFIGASPISTGGGFKTTSFFVLIALMISLFKQSPGTYIFKQKINADLLIKIGALFFSRIALIIGASILVLHFNPKIPVEKIVFEVVSAFSTVGLSAGVTFRLSDESKIVIILMMFIGRIGILNIMAFLLIRFKKQVTKDVKYREGYVILE